VYGFLNNLPDAGSSLFTDLNVCVCGMLMHDVLEVFCFFLQIMHVLCSSEIESDVLVF
jgi:hypothetical protein